MEDGNINKTVLITGAARRIGRALALDMATAGWNVAVHCNHSESEAAETAKRIEGLGRKAVVVDADLEQESEIETIVGRVADAMGPVHCLINNASMFEYDNFETATRRQWDMHLAVNLRAPFLLSQAFYLQLPTAIPGNIINLVDQRVWRLTPEFMTYTVSKSALWTLTRTMAMALAPRVRVNAIGPGPVLPSKRQSPEDFDHQVKGLLLMRASGLDEICRAIQFILETPSLTGQMIALDGGQHLNWKATGNADVQE